ncbi:hypothetical protein GIV96_10940 [Pseudomonas syringae]|nr:hypothetical protein [Pseudomonas syringae]MCF5400576.1 hypothetical protein [Pseudomonas syringae]MCF5420039.1 hypothetical protein [Pseudomonas syringae]MCF5431727.1 hypothetical protein [Pseudomonas syringae]MCF5436227.1 hypothetical protein [Pseudomonas syringae]
MALAAGLIVVLIGRLFNRLALDVGISPRVQIQPIKADALFSNGKFPHVWANGLVEFVTTHAQIAVGITCPDEPGQDWRYLGGRFICHRGTAPGRAGRRKGLGDQFRYCMLNRGHARLLIAIECFADGAVLKAEQLLARLLVFGEQWKTKVSDAFD